MKNFLLKTWLIMICLLFGVGTMWAEEYTITLSDNGTSSDGSSKIANASSAIDAKNYSVNANNFVTSIVAGNAYVYQAQSNCGWKFGNSNNAGKITINLNNAVEISSVKVTAKNASSKTADLKIGGGSAQALTSEFTDYTQTYTSGNSTSSIVIETSLHTSGDRRAYITSIVVKTADGGGSTPQPTTLSVPTNLTSSNVTTNSATLSWGAVTNASNYTVKIGETEYTGVTTNSYSATGLTANTKYTWTVKAVGDGTNYTTSDYATNANFTTEAEQGGEEPSGDGTSVVLSKDTYSDWGADNYLSNNGSVTNSPITLSASGSNSSGPVRFNADSYIQIYQNTEVTFSSVSGYKITSIVFNCTAQDNNNYGPAKLNLIEGETGSYTYSKNDGTWKGSASSVTLKASAQARVNSITIIYVADDTPTKTTPSLSFAEATYNATMGEYFNAPELNNPQGVTISYTSSATGVATVNETTGVISLVAPGTTTITASFAGDETYKEASARYQLVVAAAPVSITDKTIAEFIAAEGGKCYLTGIVSNIATNNYGNFDLTDETGTIYVYGCLTPEGEKQKFNTLGVVAGDKIKVLADEYTVFNEKNEAVNVIFVEEIEIKKTQYTVTIETPANGTLVVKEGENVLASGAQVEEGKTLTIECTPANEDYRLKNWQAVDGSTHTFTTTFTYDVTADVTIKATFELIPVYTVAFSVNGAIVQSDNLKDGANVTVPEVTVPEGKVFVGWAEAAIAGTTKDAPKFVTPSTTATATATYYAVFATQSGNVDVTYTKVTTNSFDDKAEYVLAAEESSSETTLHYFSSYEGTTANESWGVTSTDVADALVFTLSGTADALVAQDASGNYIQALATGKFRMSSSETTLKLNSNGQIYNPAANSNYNLRYNHNNGSGGFRWYSGSTGTSAYFFKKEGGAIYSDYCTTVVTPLHSDGTIKFVGTTGDGKYYATFSSTRAIKFNEAFINDAETCMASVKAYAITLVDGQIYRTDQYEVNNYGTGYTFIPANTGVLFEYVLEDGYTFDGAVPFEYADAEAEYLNAVEDNMLVPCTETAIFKAEADGNYYYKLAYGDNTNKKKLGFWWGAEDGSGNFKVKAGGAVLVVPQSSASNLRGFRFDDELGRPTGIESISNDVVAGEIYNLQGQRINRLQQGVNIVNGRKVIR